MKIYSKLLSVLLAGGMLAGCGSSGESSLKEKTASSAAEVTTVTKAETSVTKSEKQTTTTPEQTTEVTTTAEEEEDNDELRMIPKGYYDFTPVLEAYRNDDRESLSYEEKEIYDSAKHFLMDYTDENMTPYEKELAIHDKLCELVDYDNFELNVLSSHDEDSETPYGALVLGKAICSGYALTFNLLVEMAGIECITVKGLNRSEDEHLWNLVKLDDEWYGVDLTWDDLHTDAGILYVKHRFFNRDDAFFEENDHSWKKSNYPSAQGRKYSYLNMTAVEIKDMEQLEALVVENGSKGVGEAVFIPDPELLDLSYPAFEASEQFTEIRRMFVNNGYSFFQECAEMTDKGHAILIAFKTFEPGDPRYEKDSSSESDESEGSGESDASAESSEAAEGERTGESSSESESSAESASSDEAPESTADSEESKTDDDTAEAV